MTLIKKISQLHKSANAANLLSMALIMSAVSCGCGDDDKGNDEDVKISLTGPTAALKVKETAKEAEISVELKTEGGKVDPDKFKLKVTDLKHGLKTADHDKSIKELGAGTEALKKDDKKTLKFKITGADASKTFVVNDGANLADGKKTDFAVRVEGTVKEKDKDVAKNADCKVTIEFES